MNKDLKQDIKTTFSVPNPIRKQEFLMNLSLPKANRFEFILRQASYIRKRFWCLSILLFFISLCMITNNSNGTKVIGLSSAILPFLSLLGITEIHKSAASHMDEIEMVCRHNLVEVMLIRLTVIGSYFFIISCVLLIIVANTSEYNFLQTAVYVVTPFLLSSYLSLYLSNHIQTSDVLNICAGVTGFVSLSTILAMYQFDEIYMQQSVIVWIIIFLIIILLFVFEVRKMLKKMEELIWNLPLMD